MARDTTDVMVLIPTVKEWDVGEVECFFNFDSPVKPFKFFRLPSEFLEICVKLKSEACGITILTDGVAILLSF